jgi:hypothetical protein
MMRFYSQPHRFYCGIDWHARTRHLCILEDDGTVVFDKNLACSPKALRTARSPYRDGLIIGVACRFGWYWLADLCQAEAIAFVLGQALYMRLLHGGKAKNDRLDAGKSARLLPGGNFPRAYVSPKGLRETRDLLRRRLYLVHKRAERITHLAILKAQNKRPPVGTKLAYAANRADLKSAERFTDPSVQLSATRNLELIDRLDELIARAELDLTRTAKVEDVPT